MQTFRSKWLSFGVGALELGVDARSIRGWMRDPERRVALGAVRHGKQWRIPHPGDLKSWASTVRWRFKRLGHELKHPVYLRLRAKFPENSPQDLEAHRFWVAAELSADARGNWSNPETKATVSLLKRMVRKQLGGQERNFDSLRPKIAEELRGAGYSSNDVDAIMESWPDPKVLQAVRLAGTKEELERIRRRLDYLQAARIQGRDGDEPNDKPVASQLHKDMQEHINDTGEQLRGVWDFRKPQRGVSLRTFRQRYPRKGQTQRNILSMVLGYHDEIPSSDQRHRQGRTLVRRPKCED